VPADAAARATPSPWPVWPDGFGAGEEERRALLVLSALRGITPRKLLLVALECGSAAATLARIARGRAGSERDRASARTLRAEQIEAAAEACGSRFVTWSSPEYPAQLRHIHDPPAALYVIGRMPADVTSAVAVVGARRCTALGRETAHEIGHGLGLAGVTVVSGAARGIDTAAHEGALGVTGSTLAVLGSGLDVAYPFDGRPLVRRIAREGALVSEYPPGVPPSPHHFPARNRIVAGLCCATVVVEGAERSGSMITAEHAMEFGRDVFAVAGAANSAMSDTPLQLIREGATLIRGADDLLSDLGLELDHSRIDRQVELDPAERRVLAEVIEPTLPDRLAAALGVPLPEVVGTLMRLELRGFVRNVGGRFETTLKPRSTTQA
jgi:DNA processing protein